MKKRNFRTLLEAQWSWGRFLCVGLDSERARIPKCLQGADMEATAIAFNGRIIEATHDLVCAYKPNIAFYEAWGDEGLRALRATIRRIREIAPDVPVILDAKRADIGNTNLGYVRAAFEDLDADAITVHPYLGQEALQPFLDREDKGIFVLCRTSNPGAGEFQDLRVAPSIAEGRAFGTIRKTSANDPHACEMVPDMPLYQYVAYRVSRAWNARGNCGVVVGATNPEELHAVRQIVGDMPILIPGVGAQGGDLEAAVAYGRSPEGSGMIINASRSIIFASSGEDFADAARRETERLHWAIARYHEEAV